MSTSILSIDLQHEYYRDNVFSGARLDPDAVTKRTLDKYSLFMRQTRGRFELWYLGGSSAKQFIEYFTTMVDQPLTFYLNYEFDNLVTITDLPASWRGALSYSTSYVAQNSDRSSPIQLVQRTVDSSDSECNSIGTVTVHPGHLLQPDVIAARRNYLIKLLTRKTQWQYCLFNRSHVPLNKAIVSDVSGNDFTAPHPQKIDGETSLIFSSGQRLLALSEYPKETFRLLNYPEQKSSARQPAPKVLISKLPVPTADETKVALIGGEQLFRSQMYVYL